MSRDVHTHLGGNDVQNDRTHPDRRGFVGGSDVAKIINVSPYGDAFSLYLEKRGEIEPPEEETRTQRRGKILEPAIAQLYAAEHGVELDKGATLTMPDAPHFRAQVDALEDVDGSPIPIEIKSASEFTRGKWGPSGTDDAPTYYCAQLHWQLLATGMRYAYEDAAKACERFFEAADCRDAIRRRIPKESA